MHGRGIAAGFGEGGQQAVGRRLESAAGFQRDADAPVEADAVERAGQGLGIGGQASLAGGGELQHDARATTVEVFEERGVDGRRIGAGGALLDVPGETVADARRSAHGCIGCLLRGVAGIERFQADAIVRASDELLFEIAALERLLHERHPGVAGRRLEILG